jgi:hypothetical protein
MCLNKSKYVDGIMFKPKIREQAKFFWGTEGKCENRKKVEKMKEREVDIRAKRKIRQISA